MTAANVALNETRHVRSRARLRAWRRNNEWIRAFSNANLILRRDAIAYISLRVSLRERITGAGAADLILQAALWRALNDSGIRVYFGSPHAIIPSNVEFRWISAVGEPRAPNSNPRSYLIGRFAPRSLCASSWVRREMHRAFPSRRQLFTSIEIALRDCEAGVIYLKKKCLSLSRAHSLTRSRLSVFPKSHIPASRRDVFLSERADTRACFSRYWILDTLSSDYF